MAHQITSKIDVHATPDRVWEILTDFDAYPEWNPFITSLAGSPSVGGKLDVFMKPPGGRGMRFKPTVVAVEPNRELRWLGRLIVPGLFDGEHVFQIEEVAPDRVRFHQEERFKGMLVPLLMRFIESGTQKGFEAMNHALKARAEHRPTSDLRS